MNLGVTVDDDTSFAVLDRFYAAGGRLIDTANNYGSWTPGTRAGDSERLLGRWLASRGIADEIVIATKCGAGKIDPNTPPLTGQPPTNYEGLAPEVVRTQLTTSLRNLGVERVGIYYGHVDDRDRDITEIADTYSALVEEGLVAVPGLSNTVTWRLAVARAHSRQHGRPELGAWQQQHSVYWPRPGYYESGTLTPDMIDYAADEPELTIMSYAPQQQGQIVRAWMPLRDSYDHPGSHDRLRLAHQLAHDHGATANQVIMAWHLAGPTSTLSYRDGSRTHALADLTPRRAAMIPIFGASSPAQVDEAIGALDVKLTDAELELLDTP